MPSPEPDLIDEVDSALQELDKDLDFQHSTSPENVTKLKKKLTEKEAEVEELIAENTKLQNLETERNINLLKEKGNLLEVNRKLKEDLARSETEKEELEKRVNKEKKKADNLEKHADEARN